MWKVVQSNGTGAKEQDIAFSQFMQQVDEGRVSEVILMGNEVHGKYKNGDSGFHTTAPVNYPRMIDELREKGVNIVVQGSSSSGWSTYLLNLSPLIFFAALWYLMIRQMRTQRK